MWLIILLLLCIQVHAEQITLPNGDVVDQEGQVSYLITPGPQTKAYRDSQVQILDQATRDQELQVLRKQALDQVADEKIQSTPNLQLQQSIIEAPTVK